LLDKPFQQLSGGEKARVQLARCCIKESPVLLVDEPIAPLDPYYQIDMMEQLQSLTPQHTCVVAIHHLSLAYQFCDEIVLLDKGKLLAVGETQAVLNAENLAKTFHIRAEIDPMKKTISKIEKQ
jgi:fepc protein